MRSALFAAALSAVVVVPVVVPVAVAAQQDERWRDRDRDRNWERDRDGRWEGDREGWRADRAYRKGNYGERKLSRNDQIYRGQDGRYYCKRNNGTTGLVVGAIGGGVLGNVLGGGTLGTIIGAGAGGLLGREVDRGKVRCR